MPEAKFSPGDRVRHAHWPADVYAIVIRTDLMPVRARRGARGQLLRPRPEDCEAVVLLDRHMPIDESSEATDNRWMESGLISEPQPDEGPEE